uniref:Phosphoadenosine phosphosulfate reductase n=2 Tax=Lygus hesperus TaxID=30085 RepID=A0A0A9W9F8_LYGHE
MNPATVFCVLTVLGLGAACSVDNGDAVQASKLFGTWYEVDSYGDSLMAIFTKCITNSIVDTGSASGGIQKARSYKWKLFPFITWNEKSSLLNRGTKWDLTTSSWFGSSSTPMSIIKLADDFVILKTCPNAWFTDERIWVYSKNKDLTATTIAAINQALKDKNEPAYDSFRVISQTC